MFFQNIVEAKMWLLQAMLCYRQGTGTVVVNKLHLLCGERALGNLSERINVVIFMDFIFRDGK